MLRFITLLLLSLGLSACAVNGPTKVYPGPERAAEQLSVLSCGYFINIIAIDGVETGERKEFCKYAVLPGSHTITYQFYDKEPGDHRIKLYVKKHRVQVETEASYTYVFGAMKPDHQWKLVAWEKDSKGKTTQREVVLKML